MNNLNKTLLGLFATAMLCAVPAAMADPLDDLHVSKDVATSYHVDYSSALKDADAAKGIVNDAKDAAYVAAQHKTNAGLSASTGASSGILEGIRGNIDAFVGWIKSLSVKPQPEAAGNVAATSAQDTLADAKSMDGSLDGNVAGHLEATSAVQKNVPPPPTPDLGFLGGLKASFKAFLGIE